jgi:hypothetical protein
MGQYLKGTPEERFWHKVDKHGSTPEHRPDLGPCWLWTGCRSTDCHGVPSYGSLWIPTPGNKKGRMERAHRFSYELHYGPMAEGLQADHLCLNKGCVCPTHLEAVTQAENMARGPQIERARAWAAAITHCPYGHEYTPENTRDDNGHRKCRTCLAERMREYRRRKRMNA